MSATDTREPRPCANCGQPAVEHWVRPGVGSMFCEPVASGSNAKYDRGALTPDEQRNTKRIESALRAVVGVLVREGASS
jgi:hypothetical protein